MSERERLPNRRGVELLDFEHEVDRQYRQLCTRRLPSPQMLRNGKENGKAGKENGKEQAKPEAIEAAFAV